MGKDITIQHGLPEEQRARAAALYWEAFGSKLGMVMGPEPRALAFLIRVLRADHCFCAMDAQGALIGIAGFKTPSGSFAGGNAGDLAASYGRFGALWRAQALRLLASEVDNARFLVDGIAVTAEARSQGVGRALLHALYAEGQSRGYSAIRLEVIEDNWRARALYEREGFVAIQTDRLGPLRYIFGFEAATTMVRPLP